MTLITIHIGFYCIAERVGDDPQSFMFRCTIVYQTIHMGYAFSA